MSWLVVDRLGYALIKQWIPTSLLCVLLYCHVYWALQVDLLEFWACNFQGLYTLKIVQFYWKFNLKETGGLIKIWIVNVRYLKLHKIWLEIKSIWTLGQSAAFSFVFVFVFFAFFFFAQLNSRDNWKLIMSCVISGLVYNRVGIGLEMCLVTWENIKCIGRRKKIGRFVVLAASLPKRLREA